MRYPKPPLLPGKTVNFHVGQTRFHKSHQLDFVVKGVPYVTDKKLPGIGGVPLPGSETENRQSIYAQGEFIRLPPWLVFDKHVLTFDAYYLENTKEVAPYDYIVHCCKIYFFLEDGTIKVVEQKNPYQDGLSSGCIISRQRIRYPAQGSQAFYDILDFNVGYNVELYGKIFTLVNCDNFTRNFLNRLGIHVPDKIEPPEDPYTKIVKERKARSKVRPPLNKKITLERFLSDDNRKLIFFAYWDDRHNENGIVHLLHIYYYISDDTIEIKDVTDKEKYVNILKRGKLPMDVHYKFEAPGATEPHTVLNAIGSSALNLRYILDPLDLGRDHRPNYTDKDMRIGAVIAAFGRKIVIYDCDKFTREYYKVKFGIENMEPIERPDTKEEKEAKVEVKTEFIVPPYNGFGTYEDSLINCLKIHFYSTVKPYTQFLEKDRDGYDSKILRFVARGLVKNQPTGRMFLISYYLKDDTISVVEMNQFVTKTQEVFMSKREMLKPGEKNVTTRPPERYSSKDLYIGNTVCFEEFYFNIIASDEYTLRYMETHPNEFPKSNINLVTENVKAKVQPVYKKFVAAFLEQGKLPPAPYEKFRGAIQAVMCDKITEQEIITLARYYSIIPQKDTFNFQKLKLHTHDELRKYMYEDFDKLLETFHHFDPKKTGYVSKSDAYKILRGCRLPLDVEHIRVLLEKFGKGENCDIVYEELLHFINYRKDPYSKHIEPINLSAAMAWLQLCKEPENSRVSCVNMEKLVKDLDLEKDLVNQCT